MGLLLRYIKSTCGPLPRRATVTVGALPHILTQADRHAGYRLGCTCGWADEKVRWSERRAIEVGNAHIRTVRFGALRAVK